MESCFAIKHGHPQRGDNHRCHEQWQPDETTEASSNCGHNVSAIIKCWGMLHARQERAGYVCGSISNDSTSILLRSAPISSRASCSEVKTTRTAYVIVSQWYTCGSGSAGGAYGFYSGSRIIRGINICARIVSGLSLPNDERTS